jgi:hypothetical protein
MKRALNKVKKIKQSILGPMIRGSDPCVSSLISSLRDNISISFNQLFCYLLSTCSYHINMSMGYSDGIDENMLRFHIPAPFFLTS